MRSRTAVPRSGTWNSEYRHCVQPIDAALLLALLRAGDTWTVRGLSAATGIPTGSLHRSLQRLHEVRLYEPGRRSPNLAVAREFLRHGLDFVAPCELGPIRLGVPTAWGVGPLAERIRSDEPPPVWPSGHGPVRGPEVVPLLAHAAQLGASNPDLSADLALVDAVRVGDRRIRGVALDLLEARFGMAS